MAWGGGTRNEATRGVVTSDVILACSAHGGVALRRHHALPVVVEPSTLMASLDSEEKKSKPCGGRFEEAVTDVALGFTESISDHSRIYM